MGAFPDSEEARRADDEAVEWGILLREDADDPDVRARFESWLKASPLNARAWADTAHAYDRAGDARPAFSPPVRAAESRPVLPLGPVPHIRQRRPKVAARDTSGVRRIPRPRTLMVGAAVAALR